MTRLFKHTSPGIVFILWMVFHLSQGNLFAQLQTPQVDSISIYNGSPKIAWFPNTDNTLGYPILKFSFDGFIYNWKEIDTVWGATNTFYYDSTVNACEENPPYKLYASWTGNPNNSNWSKALRIIGCPLTSTRHLGVVLVKVSSRRPIPAASINSCKVPARSCQ